MRNQDSIIKNRSRELCNRVVTTESFISEAKEIYGERYNYNKVVYKNKDIRVTIVCPTHGDFKIYAREHLDGRGCPKCEKGKRFIEKLEKKFGNKFGLEEFIYESSTLPITLICPIHGPFSRLPNQVLTSAFGCPECALQVKENAHQAAIAKKEKIKQEKLQAREEFKKQRLLNWLNERSFAKSLRDSDLKLFRQNKTPNYYCFAFDIYISKVDEHIEGIRYGGWKTEYYEPFKLTEEVARKLPYYREDDNYYRFPEEAPDDYMKESFKKVYSYTGMRMEDMLSHRSCIVHFEGNDLIIQELSYNHELERLNIELKNKDKFKVEQKKHLYIPTELPKSFVSIDFETLYPQRVSACSIGMVKFINGEPKETYYSLIRPPFDYPGKCGMRMTNIHGLTEDMLINEKTFDKLLPEIEDFVNGLPLVAHNASFESKCIHDICEYYLIKTKLNYTNIYDTMVISKNIEKNHGIILRGAGTHTLDSLCYRYHVNYRNHHHALDDAEMCGDLFLEFQKINEGIATLDESKFKQENEQANTKRKKYNSEDTIQRKDIDQVVDNIFKNKIVVLTGFSINDSQTYAHKLNTLGAIIKNSVTKHTNILITGYTAGPTKLKKAEEFGVRIMPEQEYIEIINQIED